MKYTSLKCLTWLWSQGHPLSGGNIPCPLTWEAWQWKPGEEEGTRVHDGKVHESSVHSQEVVHRNCMAPQRSTFSVSVFIFYPTIFIFSAILTDFSTSLCSVRKLSAQLLKFKFSNSYFYFLCPFPWLKFSLFSHSIHSIQWVNK